MQLTAPQRSTLKEAGLAWAGVILANCILYQLYIRGAINGDWLFFLSAFCLLNVPIAIYIRRKESVVFFDASAKEFFKSLGLGLAVCLVFAIPAFAVNHFYQNTFFGAEYRSPIREVSWGMLLLNRLLMALPEEFFFRGYLQNRLNRVFGRPITILGAPVGWSLVIVSLLFALSHSLIHVQWWHIFIFFPSLVFGWLQEKRGSVTAPTVFHGMCNLFADWAALHYLV